MCGDSGSGKGVEVRSDITIVEVVVVGGIKIRINSVKLK